MSKFYGTMEGSAKNPVTRRGHTHLSTHVRGWNKGIKVVCTEENGEEVYTVYETGGSNNPTQMKEVFKTTY